MNKRKASSMEDLDFQKYLSKETIIMDEDTLSNNPHCIHGPMILMEQNVPEKGCHSFHSCTAKRGDSICSGTLLPNNVESIVKRQKEAHKEQIKSYKRFEKMKTEPVIEFCKKCEIIVLPRESFRHSKCNDFDILDKEQLKRPIELYKPLTESNAEAQFFFTSKTCDVIVQCIKNLGIQKVLCIGTPMIFQFIKRTETDMKALLMDIDKRYCQLLSPQEYVLYNLYNHYFFAGEEGKNVYLDFVKGDEKVLVCMDPPMSLSRLLSRTLSLINGDWRTANGRRTKKKISIPIFLCASLTQRLIMKKYLSYLQPIDYNLQYVNMEKRKQRSFLALRLFTNQDQSLLPLPEDKGYKFCDKCHRWTHSLNFHCDICEACTATLFESYRHCNDCKKCVQHSFSHCGNCNRCLPADHKCDYYAYLVKRRERGLENIKEENKHLTMAAEETSEEAGPTVKRKKLKMQSPSLLELQDEEDVDIEYNEFEQSDYDE